MGTLITNPEVTLASVSIYLSIDRSIDLSIYLSIYPMICVSILHHCVCWSNSLDVARMNPSILASHFIPCCCCFYLLLHPENHQFFMVSLVFPMTARVELLIYQRVSVPHFTRSALVSVNGCESMVETIQHIQSYVVRAPQFRLVGWWWETRWHPLEVIATRWGEHEEISPFTICIYDHSLSLSSLILACPIPIYLNFGMWLHQRLWTRLLCARSSRNSTSASTFPGEHWWWRKGEEQTDLNG